IMPGWYRRMMQWTVMKSLRCCVVAHLRESGGDGMAGRGRKYSLFGRPFRLQLSAEAATDFDAPASRGRCQYPDCPLFEWSNGVDYCRDHWLDVHQQTHLPERWYGS